MHSFLNNINLIERIHDLVKRKATGTPSQLACRLGISEAKLYRIMELMRVLGAPIIYDHLQNCYYYEQRVSCKFGFIIETNDLKEIRGGFSLREKYFVNFLSLSKFESVILYHCNVIKIRKHLNGIK